MLPSHCIAFLGTELLAKGPLAEVVSAVKRALDSAIGRLNDKGRHEAPPVDDAVDILSDKNLTSGV